MTGTIFIIVGIIFIGWGAVNLLGMVEKKKSGKNAGLTKEEILIELIRLAAADGIISDSEHEIIYNKANDLNIDSEVVETIIREELNKVKGMEEVVIIDKEKQKGNQFETHIASKFDKRFFKLKEWASDKYVDGLYAESNQHPDLKFLYSAGKDRCEFYVECKFRGKYFNKGIEWAEDYQFKYYKEFEEKHTAPVFVAIGVGGNPSDPDDLFIIPLKEIRHKFVSMLFLEKFKVKPKRTTFYFDHKNLTLS